MAKRRTKTILWRLEHHNLGPDFRDQHKVLVSEWRLVPYVATGNRVRPAVFAKDKVQPIVRQSAVNQVLAELDERQRSHEDKRVLVDMIKEAFCEQRFPTSYLRSRPRQRKGSLAKRLREAEQRCHDLMEEIEALKGCRALGLRLLDENVELRAGRMAPSAIVRNGKPTG